MKAQITFEFMLWVVIGSIFVLSIALAAQNAYATYSKPNFESMVSNLSNAINMSILPYSQFGIREV
ncbi:MAG: hypothetical protein QXR58_00485 [Candidatus Micrarchaeaceae archaeon]